MEEYTAQGRGVKAEDRISAKLSFWIEHERFNGHQPTDEEVEAKKEEFVSELPSREEYQQRLIDEIQRDIRSREQAA